MEKIKEGCFLVALYTNPFERAFSPKAVLLDKESRYNKFVASKTGKGPGTLFLVGWLTITLTTTVYSGKLYKRAQPGDQVESLFFYFDFFIVMSGVFWVEMERRVIVFCY